MAARALCCRVVAQAAEGSGNLSRRRSQRLQQQGRARQRAPDLQQQLQEREARLAEQQRVLQEQAPFQPLLEEEEEEGLDGMEDAAEADKDAALRSLVQNLREKGRQPGSAAAAADDDDDEPDDDEPSAGVASSGNVAVEADFIIEQRPGQGVPDVQVPEPPKPQISRQAAALLEIMGAGEEVEEAIARHRQDIDGEMLELLAARIRTARENEVENRAEVLQGLELLFRRLKAEVERQGAPPALRLLDELLSILDPGEGVRGTSAEREKRQRAAAVRVRAAFRGNITAGADVLSLAAQLGSEGGDALADRLAEDPLDPMVFMAECTQLLSRAEEQQRQLAAYVERLREQQEQEQDLQQRGAEEASPPDLAAARGALQLAQLESVLEERRAAAMLVQECLSVAEAVARSLGPK